jgi:chloramphenicol-sensitive protein RarD
MKKGTLYAIGAYVMWGFFPIYFKLIQVVPAIQIVGHRIVWSFLFLLAVLFIRREGVRLRSAIYDRRMLWAFLVSSILLALNWLTFVYGVNAGFIVESSLGYFINPLVSVLLGVIILRERLRPLQWVAVGLAALGVVYLTINYGRLPWIALALALTFGLYGLAKKIAPLGSFYGLTVETGMLFIPSLGYLLLMQSMGTGSFGQTGLSVTALLVLTGPLTAVPLLLFGAAARQINLSMLGLLQYVAPTLQFLIGVLVYREPFTISTLLGFCIIWAALVLLWTEGFVDRSRLRAMASEVEAS